MAADQLVDLAVSSGEIPPGLAGFMEHWDRAGLDTEVANYLWRNPSRRSSGRMCEPQRADPG